MNFAKKIQSNTPSYDLKNIPKQYTYSQYDLPFIIEEFRLKPANFKLNFIIINEINITNIDFYKMILERQFFYNCEIKHTNMFLVTSNDGEYFIADGIWVQNIKPTRHMNVLDSQNSSHALNKRLTSVRAYHGKESSIDEMLDTFYNIVLRTNKNFNAILPTTPLNQLECEIGATRLADIFNEKFLAVRANSVSNNFDILSELKKAINNDSNLIFYIYDQNGKKITEDLNDYIKNFYNELQDFQSSLKQQSLSRNRNPQAHK